ncbi:tail fiber protein [Qipengyuania sp. XHP0211]|uniref:tail fiber protein n=1 Tax=Qipengyuania sp. XHP0211 TaxID=3038079 RepID=UPI00241C6B93|nr:tail fiber protein [Qipengyuania sp. XHP0211]MDG5750518.1 tail fiber protein [Qipengyuania sp. XHP0211]
MHSKYDASMLRAWDSNGFGSSESEFADASKKTHAAEVANPVSNVQPYLSVNQLINLYGLYPSRDGGSGGEISLGYVLQFAGNFAPRETAFASGQLLPISQNTALFSIVGTTFGGDGWTTFALPDLDGHVAIGAGFNGTTSFGAGSYHGSDTFSITEANLPTSFGGGGMEISNYETSLALNYVIHAGSGTGANIAGSVHGFIGNFDPNGAMICDGRELAIADYPELFAAIGTTYGGDGVTTFNIPDLTGRNIVGAGQGPGLTARDVGDLVGSDSIRLDDINLPTYVGGNGASADNMQPGVVMQVLICMTGIFPSRNMEDIGKADGLEGDVPFLGQMIYYAGTDIPDGWVAASGQLLSIAQNQALFSLLGTTYGGDGRTTFALPDLRGRTMTGVEYYPGVRAGNEDLNLSPSNIPGRTQDGDEFDNAILGSDFADTFRGLAGTDTLTGNGGADALYGGNGDDILDGGADNDMLDGGFGNDTMRGGSGDDFYRLVDPGDVVIENAGEGIDTVQSVMSFARLGANVENLILAGWESSDGFGNAMANEITGNSYANTLYGVGGDDTINGRGGKDTIFAGSGNDIVYGGNAGDEIYGGIGNDELWGENGWDTIHGGSGADSIGGGEGNDVLFGGDGADQLIGEAGDDMVYGGAGNDVVSGGAGVDTLTGGDGADVFIFFAGDLEAAGNRITDFQQAQGDVIDLAPIDPVNNGESDAFAFIGTDAFSNTAGELRFEQDVASNETVVEGDIDGDGLADFVIRLDGLVDLTLTDFSL